VLAFESVDWLLVVEVPIFWPVFNLFFGHRLQFIGIKQA
jgi:hypothetical protein